MLRTGLKEFLEDLSKSLELIKCHTCFDQLCENNQKNINNLIKGVKQKLVEEKGE
jgi:hypothetical protein